MKKPYVKPTMTIEYFTPNEYVAVCCNVTGYVVDRESHRTDDAPGCIFYNRVCGKHYEGETKNYGHVHPTRTSNEITAEGFWWNDGGGGNTEGHGHFADGTDNHS